MSPRVSAILEEVAAVHGVTVKELVGPNRKTSLARARFEAMFKIRRLRNNSGGHAYSFPAIGEIFGDRDHTTAMHACRRWAEINNIVDADLLRSERQQCLDTISRVQVSIDNANKRIAEIDGLLPSAQAAA